MVLAVLLALPSSASAALFDWSFTGPLSSSHPDGFAMIGDTVTMQFTVDTSRPDRCASETAGLYTGVFSNAALSIGAVSFYPQRPHFGAVEINAPLGDCGLTMHGQPVDNGMLFRLFDVFISTTPTAPMLLAEVNFSGGYPGTDDLPTDGSRVSRLYFLWGRSSLLVLNPTVAITQRPTFDTASVPAPPVVALLPLALLGALRRRRYRRA